MFFTFICSLGFRKAVLSSFSKKKLHWKLKALSESLNSPGWKRPWKKIRCSLSGEKGTWLRLSGTLYGRILRTSSDRNSTTWLGRLFEWPVIPPVKKKSYIKTKPVLKQLVPVVSCLFHVAPCEESSGDSLYSRNLGLSLSLWNYTGRN